MKTILELVNDVKAGNAIDPVEARNTILALHSMLTKSRMALEAIAEKSDNAENLYYTTRAFLGNLDKVVDERTAWMGAVPSRWLQDQEIREREVLSFWDTLKENQ